MEYGYGVYNFMDSWSEKKTTECLFIIIANTNTNANANSKKHANIRICECEYSDHH